MKLLRALVLCVLSAGVAVAQTNPLLDHADPFITLHPVQGKYVLLATTGNNITLWSGATVPTAAQESKVVFTAPEGMDQVWSPTLWQMQGKWWIYFTARMNKGGHAIYVLSSDAKDVFGSYTFHGALELGRPSIDPSLLMVKGVPYLMYVTVDRGENAIWMTKLSSPLQPVGEKALIAEPEYPWERGAGTTKNYPVNEGPTALYHAGKTFVVYSGSDTASPRYCLGLLTFRGGDPLVRANWVKTKEPVFEANPANGIYGPGRGTFAQDAGGWWLLYAAKATDDPTSRNRAVRAQRFVWKDGVPVFGVPMMGRSTLADRPCWS
ncbi:glycoside hydrolase family 43 protein [Terriglobus sp. TAA 43]|uniref:glycoside hydrolase family 43 protein n=1 Tax=Terriglobus sp. TAA 43 TaxID=278961 RepID=UPI0006457E0D|nr:glycoside hydrolase family 43 protein [Terriglobus sp. TAA 43]